MAKRAFLLFIICGILIILAGIFFEITKRTSIFRLDEGPLDFREYRGWQIMLMGIAMIALGLFLKWVSLKQEKH